MMASTKKRVLSLLMALSLMLGMVPVTAVAATPEEEQAVKQISSDWDGGTVYYKADGTTGSRSDWAVKLSRTLNATGNENLFNVDMEIEVKDGQTQIATKSAAVTLVLDTSGSMAYCAQCGSTWSHGQTSSSTEWQLQCNHQPGSQWVDENGRRGDGICDNCGYGSRSHTWKEVTVAEGHAFQSRLDAAKAAMVSFLNAYAKDENGNFYTSPRMVSLVTYATNDTTWDLSSASGNQYWVDVTNQTNLNYVINNVIYGTNKYGSAKISADGGTNTDAGVGAAAKLLNTSGNYASQIGGIDNRFCVLLTDGEPTYNDHNYSPSGSGYSCYSGDTYGAQVSCKAVTDTGAKLYSIAYNLADKTVPAKRTQNGNSQDVNIITKTGNEVTGGWLKDYCGSTEVYDAKNSGSLITAFNDILNIQTSSTTSVVSTIVGQQAEGDTRYFYSFIGFLDDQKDLVEGGYNGATQANSAITWDLNEADFTHNDSAKTTTYSLSYQVRLDNAVDGFQDWDPSKTEYNVGDAKLTFTHTALNGTVTNPTVPFPQVKAHGYLAALELTKVAYHNNDQKLPGAVFQLDSTDHASRYWPSPIHRESASDLNGKVTFKNNNLELIPSGYQYDLTEKDAPQGYDKDETFSEHITVAYGQVSGHSARTVANKLTQTRGDITITKTWAKPAGMSTQPITVNVYRADASSSNSTYKTPQLYGSFTANDRNVTSRTGSLEGVTIQASVNANGGPKWTYTLKNLPTNIPETGGTWTYSVTEETVPGFDTTVDGLNIRNVASGKTSVSVEKVWILPQGAQWPAVEVQLLRDGKAQGAAVTLNGENHFSHTWSELPQYSDLDGHAYRYTVTESFDTSKYQQVSQTTGANGAIVFTNTVREGLTVDKEITKTWNDDNGEGRPNSIQVQLKQNGENYGAPVTLIASGQGKNVTVSGNTWTYKFENLPAYHFTEVNGTVTAVEAYTYTVEEVGTIEGYTSTHSDLHIENTRSATATVQVSKVWEDEFSSHPDVEIQLYQSSATAGTQAYGEPVSVSEGETVSIENVPLYDVNGQPYTYTVVETDVPGGYRVSYDYGTGNDKIVFTQGTGSAEVTNTLVTKDDKTTYTITKTWQQPSDLEKPDLSVQLFQVDADGNEETYGDYTVLSADGTLTISDLPKYYYEQEMEEVTDPETGAVTQEPTGKVIEREYTYYATETCPEGYTAKEPVESENGITFINTITGQVTVKLNKSWADIAKPNPDRTGAVITVSRYVDNGQGGKAYDENWNEVWNVDGASKEYTNLAKYDENGNLYFYEAAETTTPAGYSSSGGSVDEDNSENFQFSFRNTLDDNGTTHPVIKRWVDGGKTDANRPDITVILNQGAAEFARVTVSGNGTYTVTSDKSNLSGAAYSETDVTVTQNYSEDANQWYILFGNLPLYNADRTVAYTYTADEDDVTGYDKAVSGNTITNTLEQDSTLSLSFTKSWVDPQGTEHPNVTFQLVATKPAASADTNEYGQTVTLGFSDGATQPTNEGAEVTSSSWEYTFENLHRYTTDRYPISYSIRETSTLSNYDQVGPTEANVFTNTLKQDYVTAGLTKTWDNSYTGYLPEEQQPEDVNSITVQLYRRVGENQVEPVGTPIVLTVGETADLTVDDNGVWTYAPDTQLEKYDENRQVYTYFFREVYAINDTYAQVVDTTALPVNGREYLASYADSAADGTFTTGITNTFLNPLDYYYQVIRTYDTYVSGSIVESRQEVVTGEVNIQDETTTINVDAGDYLTYVKDGVTSDTFAFVQGRVNTNNGTSTTVGEDQTSPEFSQELTDPNVLYIFDLYYRLDLYKLNVNYVFTSGSKPASGFENYTDAREYKAGESYTAIRLDAPDGYELYDVKVSDSAETATTPRTEDISFATGTFGSHDVTVTYYYKQKVGQSVTIDPSFTIQKVDGSGAAITSSAATFGVFSDAECTGDPAKTISTQTTNGAVSVRASELGEGTWYLKETNAPTGYTIPVNAPVWTVIVGRSESTSLVGGQFVTTTTWTLSVKAADSNESALNSSRELVVTNDLITAEYTVEYYFETGADTGVYEQKSQYPNKAETLDSFQTVYATAHYLNDVPSGYVHGHDSVASISIDTPEAERVIKIYYNYSRPEANAKTITVTKSWDDGDNRDGLRPATITVQLFCDGVAIPNKTALVPTTGTATVDISYDSYLYDGTITVKEVGYTNSQGEYHEGVPTGYTSTDGTADNGYEVVNTHAPETVAIQAQKVWRSGRQQAVTFHLYAGSTAVDAAPITLDGTVDDVETEAWKGAFSGTFYKYSEGKLIDYTVREDSLGSNWSYTVSKSDLTDDGSQQITGYLFTVSNSYSSGGGSDPDPDPTPTDPEPDPDPELDIPDEDVPLGELPEEPVMEIPDEEVPLAEAPATGDQLTAWVLAAAVSGVGLVWLAITGKKRKDEEA